MHMEGMANIRMCANNIQATLQVAVNSELKETMLISCDDLRKLRDTAGLPKRRSHGQATEPTFVTEDEATPLIRQNFKR